MKAFFKNSKWLRVVVLMTLDVLITVGVTFLLAFLRGFSGWSDIEAVLSLCAINAVVLPLSQLIFTLNKKMWRYAEAFEYLLLCMAYAFTAIISMYLCEFAFRLDMSRMFELSVITTSLVGSMIMRLFYRAGILEYFSGRKNKGKVKQAQTDVLILGAGNAALILIDEISRNSNGKYRVWGILDDDKLKIGKNIRNIPVRGKINDAPKILQGSEVKLTILAIPSLDAKRRKEIAELFAETGCELRIMPEASMLMELPMGNVMASTRSVKIEDLLGRKIVPLSNTGAHEIITGKTVLVTGGGGSIGSELCRQLTAAGAGRIVIFDIYENDSYLLYRDLKEKFSKASVYVEIGSIVDKRRVKYVFEKYRPSLVFHAAAHKHVPLMQASAYEAVTNNIFGSYNVMTEAYRTKVDKFVLISTDKAVNPTNIMGATKRYCELMLSAISTLPDCKTEFAAVRFGNVLGSHGSVIPIFQKQISEGGPVTVTDKRIIRYFMTISEAVSLILKTATIAGNNEVFVLDMGEPVKIIELAEKMVKLSGYTPYEDIKIIETGLRSGEKLYEELLIDKKIHSRTSVDGVFIESGATSYSFDRVQLDFAEVQKAIDSYSDSSVEECLRKMVPTFTTAEAVNDAAVKSGRFDGTNGTGGIRSDSELANEKNDKVLGAQITASARL